MDKKVLSLITPEDLRVFVAEVDSVFDEESGETVLRSAYPITEACCARAIERIRTSVSAAEMEPMKRRYDQLVSIAEVVCCGKLTEDRTDMSVKIRALVAWRLAEEGHSRTKIGNVMGRQHSTVTELINKIKTWKCVPGFYYNELTQLNRFEYLAKEGDHEKH